MTWLSCKARSWSPNRLGGISFRIGGANCTSNMYREFEIPMHLSETHDDSACANVRKTNPVKCSQSSAIDWSSCDVRAASVDSTIMEHLKTHERQVISNLCSRQVAGRCSSKQKGIHVKMHWQRALRPWIEMLFATCLKGSSYLMLERHILLNACSVVSSRGRPSTRGKIELVMFPQAYGIKIFLPTLTIILKNAVLFANGVHC